MPTQRETRRGPPPIGESLQEYGRGLAGGLLFSLPLLYTMEVWWTGFIAHPHRLTGLLAFTFVLLLGYNRFAGLRHDADWLEVAIDSVEELGLGLVTSTAVLFLLGRIGPGMSSGEILGQIVTEATVVAIGFSVGTAQLNASSDDNIGEGEELRSDGRSPRFIRELVIAFCGAVLFAANVAPTEEIVVIAVETGPYRLAALALVSFGVGSVILYFTNFKRADTLMHHGSKTGIVLGSTVTYAIALTASAIILWFFGRFDGVAADVAVRQVVVLAFPGTLGASAGRLLLGL
jgi:putative integral membrane protein (TIGR02587 family)